MPQIKLAARWCCALVTGVMGVMVDETWVRRTERELGSVGERLRSVENADAALRTEMREGFAKNERALSDGMRQLGESVTRESMHTRGEIARLDQLHQENRRADEKRSNDMREQNEKRNAELIDTLKKQATESEVAARTAAEVAAKTAANSSRPFVAIAVIVGLALQWIVEHIPVVTRIMESMPQ